MFGRKYNCPSVATTGEWRPFVVAIATDKLHELAGERRRRVKTAKATLGHRRWMARSKVSSRGETCGCDFEGAKVDFEATIKPTG
jgi:hypothetical protein